MTIDDLVLPAVADLTGPRAADVLRPVVDAAGGTLERARCVQVHYAPGRELVVRFDCEVRWASGRARETLLAATALGGPLPGAVAVVADSPTGALEVSVWRWPFDPVVVGLGSAATPDRLVGHLGDHVAGPVRVDVVAYRPTERAVMRVTDAAGTTSYLKIVPPPAVAALVERHRVARAAGLPVPEVLLADEDHGLLLLTTVPGSTLRDRIKSASGIWPPPSEVAALLGMLRRSDGGRALTSVRGSRTGDAMAHGRFVRSVLPDAHDRLDRIEERLAVLVPRSDDRPRVLGHGDLHEAQVFVGADGSVTGLIDLDDLGPTDVLDDPGVLIGHLEYRALTSPDPGTVAGLRRYVARLREHFGDLAGPEALDATVGAVLVGLATGPFRAQHPSWPELTHAVLDLAERYLGAPSARRASTGRLADEGILSSVSGTAHRAVGPWPSTNR